MFEHSYVQVMSTPNELKTAKNCHYAEVCAFMQRVRVQSMTWESHQVFIVNQMPMESMMKKPNHAADMKNANKGTSGQNKTHAKNQGNRGQQLNPNQRPGTPKKP
ncbi:hypothetical protein GE300_12525 [Rhodobacteraceae bacterium 2CG4]|uniref:Uncharacterized protein n=1 Tax=Halovulum marinum TaxID=2662447 RepID=A0A6L5Z1J7_9RHOB|nr:hypothetical protein [Halovulum marinum]MSU90433.1 hypothetical protein [Halovulum marinum]